MKFMILIILGAALPACAENPDGFELNTGADTDADAGVDADADADADTDTDTDTDTDFIIPDFVCDEWSCSAPTTTCETGDYWVCPLVPETVFIAAATYKTQWLFCVDVDGVPVCPTNGYHRDCGLASGIGLVCHE